MFCHKCGNQLPDGSGFCHKCGAKLVIDEKTSQPPPSQPTSPSHAYQINAGNQHTNVQNTVSELSKRIKIVSIMGIVLASLLALAAIVNIYTIADMKSNPWNYMALYLANPDIDLNTVANYLWIDVILFIALSAYSFYSNLKYLGFSKRIMSDASGISGAYTPIGKFVVPIVGYGVLLILGLINIAALTIAISVFAIVIGILNITYVRKYALVNRAGF